MGHGRCVPFVLGIAVAGRFSWPLLFLLPATSAFFISRESLLVWQRARHRLKRVLKPTGSFWLNIGDAYQRKSLKRFCACPSRSSSTAPDWARARFLAIRNWVPCAVNSKCCCRKQGSTTVTWAVVICSRAATGSCWAAHLITTTGRSSRSLSRQLKSSKRTLG